MKSVKKVFLSVINVISVILIIFAVFVLLMVLFTKSGEATNFFGYSAFRVSTGSMAPTLEVNTFIVVKHVEPGELKVGDIITFFSNDPDLGGAINTHRITRVDQNSSGYEYYTKGDANNIEDKYVIPHERVIGKLVFSSYAIGVIVRLLSNPLIFAPLIVIPLLIIIISNLARTFKIARDIADEEDEKAMQEIAEAIKKSKEKKKAKEAAASKKTDEAEKDI